MANFKKPESVLVVIYIKANKKVLMLQRKDDPTFWQSVTGSLEQDETPIQAAIREIKEETGIDVITDGLTLMDTGHTVIFDIFPQFLHRYAPGITKNKEYWFYLPLPYAYPLWLTEHDDHHWLSCDKAIALTKSSNNAEAILKLKDNKYPFI